MYRTAAKIWVMGAAISGILSINMPLEKGVTYGLFAVTMAIFAHAFLTSTTEKD